MKVAIALWLMVIFLASLAEAAEVRLLPSVSEQVEYNDNVFVTPTQQVHDVISTTSGGMELLENTERTNLDLSAKVNELVYCRNPSLDSTDQAYNGTLLYAVSPTLSLLTRGSFITDSRPDRLLYTTGLVLNSSRAEHSTGGITGSYNLTDTTTASLAYDYGHDWYRSSQLVDFTSDASSLSFVHDMSRYIPSAKASLTFAYSRYDFTGMEIDNYEAQAGLQYALHEKWSFLMNVGPRYTESTFQAMELLGIVGRREYYTIQNQTASGWAPAGSATLSYKGEVTTGDLTLNRDVMPAYGSLGTVERTAVTLTANRRLTYELSGTLSAGYFTNVSKAGQFAVNAINYETYFATPGIRYEFNRDMYLEGSYSFVEVDNKEAGTTAFRNLFMVRFFVQHAIME
ncbi:MAG: hypothetical protein ABSC19_14995 [Syntrophorhabdales bacterium]|jgi:hypothetical protein